jgi:hypothetical protein
MPLHRSGSPLLSPTARSSTWSTTCHTTFFRNLLFPHRNPQYSSNRLEIEWLLVLFSVMLCKAEGALVGEIVQVCKRSVVFRNLSQGFLRCYCALNQSHPSILLMPLSVALVHPSSRSSTWSTIWHATFLRNSLFPHRNPQYRSKRLEIDWLPFLFSVMLCKAEGALAGLFV